MWAWWARTRLLGAVLLASSLALPVLTCASPHDRGADASGSASRTFLVEAPGGPAFALLFLWPAGLWLARRALRRPADRRALWWSEPLLCAATALILLYVGFIGTFTLSHAGAGFVAAWLGTLLLFVAWLGEGVTHLRGGAGPPPD